MTAVYREVKVLQEDLKKEGFYGGEVTGRYDAATHEAVKAIVASGKLGDPVPVPDPAEDAYGSVIAAIAKEMRLSDTSAEAVRTAYAEWAHEPQRIAMWHTGARPQVLGDLGIEFQMAAGSVNAIRRLQTALKKAGLFAGAIDGKYTTLVEDGFQKFARAVGTTVAAILAAGANARLNMNAADIRAVKDARTTFLATTRPTVEAYTTPSKQPEVKKFQPYVKKIAPVDVKKIAPVDVKKIAPVDVKKIAPVDVEKMPPLVDPKKAIYELQTLLKQGGYISGDPDGVYDVNLEIAFGNWAANTNTTIDNFLATAPGPYKTGIKQARDTYLASGGQAYPTGQQITPPVPPAEIPPMLPIPPVPPTYVPPTYVPPERYAPPEALPPEALPPEALPPEVTPLPEALPALPPPAVVKTAVAEKPKWQKWLIYGGIAVAVGSAVWWYSKKRKTAALFGDEGEGCSCAHNADEVEE